jgi:hypothetical protein
VPAGRGEHGGASHESAAGAQGRQGSEAGGATGVDRPASRRQPPAGREGGAGWLRGKGREQGWSGGGSPLGGGCHEHGDELD